MGFPRFFLACWNGAAPAADIFTRRLRTSCVDNNHTNDEYNQQRTNDNDGLPMAQIHEGTSLTCTWSVMCGRWWRVNAIKRVLRYRDFVCLALRRPQARRTPCMPDTLVYACLLILFHACLLA